MGGSLGSRSVDILTPAPANRLGGRTLDLPSPSKVRRMPVSETLRSFRRNAVHVRQALELLQNDAGQRQVDSGYLTDEGLLERYKRLSIPVRRALNPTDRASFAAGARGTRGRAGRASVDARGGQSLMDRAAAGAGQPGGPRRIARAAPPDPRGLARRRGVLRQARSRSRVRPLIDRWGKAAEGIGSQLMEDAARVIVQLDEQAAAALGEPVILPPPAKTPPPPPDPKERGGRRALENRSDSSYDRYGRST